MNASAFSFFFLLFYIHLAYFAFEICVQLSARW